MVSVACGVIDNGAIADWSHSESTRELTFRDSYERTYRIKDLGVGGVWEFEMYEIFFLERISQPHLACLLVNGVGPKEDLCRGELLCAMSLLWQCVARDKNYKYRVHPVRLFSSSIICCTQA